MGKEESTRKRKYNLIQECFNNHHLKNNFKGRKTPGWKKKLVNPPRNEHYQNISTSAPLNALRGKHHMVKIHQNNLPPDTEKITWKREYT